MHRSNDEPERKLIDIARSGPWFMRALRAVYALELDDWCIGAGAVRNLVWDALHDKTSPLQLNDIGRWSRRPSLHMIRPTPPSADADAFDHVLFE